MGCNNCTNDYNNCYGNTVYDGCVIIEESIPYLGLDVNSSLNDFIDETVTKLQSIETLTTDASAIQIAINLGCIEFSNNCLNDLDYTYTLTETAGGVTYTQDYSSVISTNDLTSYVVQTKIISNNAVLISVNNVNPYTYVFNNLQLPATIVNDLYTTISGELIHITNTINIDNCISGTFSTNFVCSPSNNNFKGSVLTLLTLMNKKICLLENQIKAIQAQL